MQKTYQVYHRLPKNMAGSILYPLNQLAQRFPEIYANQVRKYTNREALLERIIPKLNCLWNDVIHFSPVHPEAIRDGLRAAGINRYPKRWIQIDPAAFALNQGNTVIYYSIRKAKGDHSISEKQIGPFCHQALEDVAQLPTETVDYYQEANARGENPVLFRFVPHILYYGSINIEKATILTL